MRPALATALIVVGTAAGLPVGAQNYDESKVPHFSLPDPLVFVDGSPVSTPRAWRERRRAEILELFQDSVYGRTPDRPYELQIEPGVVDDDALDGKATLKEVELRLLAGSETLVLNLVLFVPNERRSPAPAFLGLNFYGNHSIHPATGITLSGAWMTENDDFGIVEHRATERSRGVRSHRWPVELLIDRGYGLVTLYYGDIDPDFDDGFQNGVHRLFDADTNVNINVDGTSRRPDAWGSIAAWAFGLSRAMDYLEVDPAIDASRVALMGHSRLGKAALWAGASDERFAVVISNDSGCGGAALSRRQFGETLEAINARFPHWFCRNFHRYNGLEDELPVDQHMLLALIAPRPLYVASAVEDQWADPRGEFLSLKHASAVYELLGAEGLSAEQWPEPDSPITGTLGYHVRTGGHDVTDYDWERFLDFADRHFQNK